MPGAALARALLVALVAAEASSLSRGHPRYAQRTAAPSPRRRRLPDAALDADAARREAAAARNCASNQADGRRGPQGRRHVAG